MFDVTYQLREESVRWMLDVSKNLLRLFVQYLLMFGVQSK